MPRGKGGRGEKEDSVDGRHAFGESWENWANRGARETFVWGGGQGEGTGPGAEEWLDAVKQLLVKMKNVPDGIVWPLQIHISGSKCATGGPLATSRQSMFLNKCCLLPKVVANGEVLFTSSRPFVAMFPMPFNESSDAWLPMTTRGNQPDVKPDGGGGSYITWKKYHAFALGYEDDARWCDDPYGTQTSRWHKLKAIGFPPNKALLHMRFLIISGTKIQVNVPPEAFGNPKLWGCAYLGTRTSSAYIRWVMYKGGVRPRMTITSPSGRPQMNALPAGMRVVAVSPRVRYNPQDVPTENWWQPVFLKTDRSLTEPGWNTYKMSHSHLIFGDCTVRPAKMVAMRHNPGCRLAKLDRPLAVLSQDANGGNSFHVCVSPQWACKCIKDCPATKRMFTCKARMQNAPGVGPHVPSYLHLCTNDGKRLGVMEKFDFPRAQV